MWLEDEGLAERLNIAGLGLAIAFSVELPLLALGGLAYTAGVPFFLADHARWTHALWHGFVLAGSGLHVAAIALVVLP